MSARALLGVLALSVSAGACGGTQVDAPLVDDGSTYVPGATWRTAPAGTLGISESRLSALQDDLGAGRYGAVEAVIVVRYGYLALEYYNAWTASRPHTLQSVTKSLTAVLFGIATARLPAATTRLDRPVLEVFSRYNGIQNVDPRKQALTLDDLLTMRTGMDFWENPYPGSPLDQLNRSSDDWVRFILDRPMSGAPGTAWAYNSGAAILMCGVIREVTGERPDQFAQRELFEPIGVTSATWFRSPYDGLPHCGGGLSLTPLDLARVGYLVLRGGRWGERQVVSSAWLESSTAPVTRPVPGFFSGANPGYGRFWWIFPTRRGGTDRGVIAASGSGGQWLFVVPSRKLVVAVAAAGGYGLDLLYDGVLPALAP